MKRIIIISLIFCVLLSCKHNVTSVESDKTDKSDIDNETSLDYGYINEEPLPRLLDVTSIYSFSDEIIPQELLNSEGDFELVSLTGESYSPFLITENCIHILVPQDADLTHLVPLVPVGKTVTKINNNTLLKYYNFSDFRNPVKIVVFDGINEKEFTIQLYDLPVITIDTPGNEEIISKDERVENCSVKLFNTDNTVTNLGVAGIKVRGNSSSGYTKKPYNVKFNSKQSVFGLKKSKKWILLANAYFDRTQLKNATAFEIARKTNYNWVQSGEFVEVIINETHRGLYYLCEKIDVEKGRIDIDELKQSDLDEEKITGGYLIEGDLDKEAFWFKTDYYNTTGTNNWPLFWSLKSPDENIPNEQLEYIKQHMNKMFGYVYNTGDDSINPLTMDYLDYDSAINWYLVEELCCNEEASRTKNMYLYKKRSDNKIYVGPPWDFDAYSFGIAYSKYFYVKEYAFCYKKLLTDPVFLSKTKEKLSNYTSLWQEQIIPYINEQYYKIHRAAERNELMYSNEWENTQKFHEESYKDLIIDMKIAFYNQLVFLNEQFNKM